MVVKNAHEKLDPKHVKEKSFDDLEFNILIAGELELAALHNISSEERDARISIACTLCYHKKYLGDTDLHEGYDTVLKQVEQGKINWGDDLGSKLHEHLDYRANVIIRDRLAAQGSSHKQESGRIPNDKKTTVDSAKPDKVIYCLEYNLGTCPQHDHHKGRFGQKKVTKFHICRKCHKDGDFKSHRDGDDNYPKK